MRTHKSGSETSWPKTSNGEWLPSGSALGNQAVPMQHKRSAIVKPALDRKQILTPMALQKICHSTIPNQVVARHFQLGFPAHIHSSTHWKVAQSRVPDQRKIEAVELIIWTTFWGLGRIKTISIDARPPRALCWKLSRICTASCQRLSYWSYSLFPPLRAIAHFTWH